MFQNFRREDHVETLGLTIANHAEEPGMRAERARQQVRAALRVGLVRCGGKTRSKQLLDQIAVACAEVEAFRAVAQPGLHDLKKLRPGEPAERKLAQTGATHAVP